MTIFSALNAGVTGIQSNGAEISIKADNISNVNTPAAKRFEAVRKSLVKPVEGTYAAAGVELDVIATVNVQGTVESTSVITDMAIEGNGMFIVSSQAGDGVTNPKFTRQGDFRFDKQGNLVNSAGMFLKGYKLTGNSAVDNNKLSAGTVNNLTTININDIGSSPTKTSSMEIAGNLKAGQSVLEGSGAVISTPLNSVHNRNLGMMDVLYPADGLEIGDTVTIKFGKNTQTSTFKYGGLSIGNRIDSDFNLFGATSATDKFKNLEEGDTVTLNTSAVSAPVEFSFKKEAPDKTRAQFNNLETLAAAIDYNSAFNARIADYKLVISPADENDYITFANSSESGPSLVSKDLSKDPSLGHGLSTSSLSSNNIASTIFGVTGLGTTFTGLAVGDGFSISTDKDTFNFTFQSTTPTAAEGEFKDMNSLMGAINASTNGQLNASITSGVLIISNTAQSNGILETRDLGTTSIVSPLGIRVQNSFSVSDGATIGDGMAVKIGSYTTAQSSDLPFANTEVLGEYSVVTGTKAITAATPVLGANATNVSFPQAVTGDGITITTDTGSVSFEFNSDFTHLNSLVAAINGSTINPSVVASNPGGRLILTAGGTNHIKSVVNYGNGGTNFADALGIAVTEPTVSDTIKIVLDSGDDEEFTFTGASNGSAAGGMPDTAIGEFNNLTTLVQSINDKLANKVSSVVGTNSMNVTRDGNNTLHSIISGGTSDIANALNIGLTTKDVILKYTGLTQGSAAGSRPDVSLGEFNNLLTLSQSIKSMTDDQASLSFSNNGNRFMVSVENGGKVSYINDYNDEGESNFATELGIRGVDMVSSFGMMNVSADSNRFSTLSGLQNAADDVVGLGSKYKNGDMTIFNADPMSQIEFSASTTDAANFFNLPAAKLDAKYDPLIQSSNMASGNIDSHMSRSIHVVDSLGASHEMNIGFIKSGKNEWQFEVFAKDINEISTNRNDSLLAYGSLSFNGSGKMVGSTFNPVFAPASTSTPPMFRVEWQNGADFNDIAFDFEDESSTAGSPINVADGMRQVEGEYVINKLIQNGLKVSSPSSIEISGDGIITANLDGTLKDAYQIQLANFVNPNGLNLEGYNVYSSTKSAGSYTVSNPGSSTTGKVYASSLEKSNVEIVSELSQMIIIQRAYQANAKVIQTANQVMEELNKIMT